MSGSEKKGSLQSIRLHLIIGLAVANLLRPGAGINADPAALDPKAVASYTSGAQQLHGEPRRPDGELGGVVLRHGQVRDPLLGEPALVRQPRRPVGEQAGGLAVQS